MALIMIAVVAYFWGFGTAAVIGDDDAGEGQTAHPPPDPPPASTLLGRLRRRALTIYAFLATAYMLIPIAVIALFSFNDPAGNFNTDWQGFTLEHWGDPFDDTGLDVRSRYEPRACRARHADRYCSRDAAGAGFGPAPLPRPACGQHADPRADGDARGGDRRGAALDVRLHRSVAWIRNVARRPRDVLDQLRGGGDPGAADRARSRSRGSCGRPRRGSREPVSDDHAAATLARDPRGSGARIRAFDRRLRHLELQLGAA